MADSRITDYTRTIVTSGTTIDPADENTNRTNIATSINNLNDVATDLESNYSSSSEPTSKVTGKIYHDSANTYNRMQWYAGSAFRPFGYDVISRSKNLILSSITNTTIDADADFVTCINTTGDYYLVADLNQTFDITTDLISGTLEKDSTWYKLWISATDAGVITRFMVPDITGTADSYSANKLVDSAADFVTDKIAVGDIVRNLTDGTQGAVTAIDDLNTLAFATDLFPDGDEDYEISLLTPSGLGSYKAHIGWAYNNSSSHIDKSRKKGEARVTTALWHTVNGYGSSSTKIQKFTTEVDASDDVVVTVVNSGTLGFVITANMDCVVAGVYIPYTSGIAQVGVSKNSTQLTTNIQSITASNRISYGVVFTGNAPEPVPFESVLKKGDTLRPHTDGTADGATAIGSISVIATEII